ncbi:MAG: hypothetical protein AAGB31_01250 [Bdellovibrio sp.]
MNKEVGFLPKFVPTLKITHLSSTRDINRKYTPKPGPPARMDARDRQRRSRQPVEPGWRVLV